MVSRLAGALAGLGLRKNDRIGLLSRNTDRFCQVVLGIAWAGAVVVPPKTPVERQRDRLCAR